MTWRRLDEIVVDFGLNPRSAVDRDWVEQLKENLDNLPAAVVVDTGNGEYLVDGFHRYYAHAESGRDEMEVERLVASLDEARDLALSLNLTHGKRLTPPEREKAVLDYRARHPRMSPQAIAANLGLGRRTVERIIQVADETRSTSQPLARAHELALAQSRLTGRQKEDIRRAARGRGWTARQVRDAVKTVASPDVAEGYKQHLLSGRAEPVTFTGTGEPAFAPSQMEGQISEALAREIQLRLRRALKVIDELTTVTPEDLIATTRDKDAFDLLERLYKLTTWVSEIRSRLSGKLQEAWQST